MSLIRFACATVIMLAVTVFRSVAALAAELPNVLMIVADDHAPYVCGAYGNKQARTPNLDRLARTGVTFTHAFVNCPLCTATRQSLLTGRLPHSIGVTQLQTPLPDEAVTLAEVFKENGYDTAAFGKMHFNSTRKHGFDIHLDLADHNRYRKENPARPVPADIGVLPPWKPFRDPASIWLNGMYAPYGAYDNDMPGTWFARQGQQYLRDRAQSKKPFFLVVSFYEPHSPFHFPVEYGQSFDPQDFDVPAVHPQDDWQIPEIFRHLTPEQKRRIAAAYYTSTMYMDCNAGRVLDTLDETGLSGNTMVVYLGDHGYSLGQHGRFEKHTQFEESVRAALLMRLPDSERADVDVDALVEFIDIFPTVTDFCGIGNPPDIEGRSLLPLLKGESTEGREFVFSEYYDNEEAMVRNRHYKFIYSTGKRERQDGYKTGLPLPGRTRILYDELLDPHELTNLAGDPVFRQLIPDFEREMLRRFETTHPAAIDIPPGLDLEDQLDYYLAWREEKR